jgi:hypothetical protein
MRTTAWDYAVIGLTGVIVATAFAVRDSSAAVLHQDVGANSVTPDWSFELVNVFSPKLTVCHYHCTHSLREVVRCEEYSSRACWPRP